jgi:hypothetical protein
MRRQNQAALPNGLGLHFIKTKISTVDVVAKQIFHKWKNAYFG